MDPTNNTTATPGGPSERERHDAEPGTDGACLICGSKDRRDYRHK